MGISKGKIYRWIEGTENPYVIISDPFLGLDDEKRAIIMFRDGSIRSVCCRYLGVWPDLEL